MFRVWGLGFTVEDFCTALGAGRAWETTISTLEKGLASGCRATFLCLAKNAPSLFLSPLSLSHTLSLSLACFRSLSLSLLNDASPTFP